MTEEMYARLLHHARRVCPSDPAIDPEDLCQQAWLLSRHFLALDKPEAEQTAYLRRVITNVAISARRNSRGRGIAQAVPLADWTRWRGSVEDEALARAELGAIIAAASGGDTFAITLLLMGTVGSRQAAAILGVQQTTILTRQYRWRKAHAEATC